MSTTPLWFGPDERPLLGFLHAPDSGSARGGVVICPPIGNELAHSHYALRLLAAELADAGLVALRFDFAGTGDSSGDASEPGQVDAWLQSIEDAVELVRRTVEGDVACVGLRVGATLAATVAARDGGLSALVLWDPCVSGATFIREQRARMAMAVRGSATHEDGVELPGYVFSTETVEAVRALSVTGPDGPLAPRVLVLADPARPRDPRLETFLGESGAERQEYCERLPVFDTGELRFEPPRPVIAQLASWLERTFPAEARPYSMPAEAASGSAVVATAPDGSAIVESVMEIGPAGLFGISSQAPELEPAGPPILLLSVAGEPRSGPARQWTALARQWAALGYRVVRFDLSGLGDSPPRSGRPERITYAPEAPQDVIDAAHAVSPGDPADVVVVGLCSGASAALAVAPHLRPRHVVVVNPLLIPSAFDMLSQDDPPGPKRRRAGLLPRVLQPLAWRYVYGLNPEYAPRRLLKPLVEANVPMFLVCGEGEAKPFQGRGAGRLRRLVMPHDFELEVVPGLDHSLLTRSSREAVARLVTSRLEQEFPPPPAERSRTPAVLGSRPALR